MLGSLLVVGGFRGRWVSWTLGFVVGFVIGRHWVSLLKSVVVGFGFGRHWVWSSLGLVVILFVYSVVVDLGFVDQHNVYHFIGIEHR